MLMTKRGVRRAFSAGQVWKRRAHPPQGGGSYMRVVVLMAKHGGRWWIEPFDNVGSGGRWAKETTLRCYTFVADSLDDVLPGGA